MFLKRAKNPSKNNIKRKISNGRKIKRKPISSHNEETVNVPEQVCISLCIILEHAWQLDVRDLALDGEAAVTIRYEVRVASFLLFILFPSLSTYVLFIVRVVWSRFSPQTIPIIRIRQFLFRAVHIFSLCFADAV